MNIQMTSNGMVLEVKVRPGSRFQRLQVKDGLFILDIRAKPEKGRANKEVLGFFKGFFGKDVEIVSGMKSRQKKILIKGVTLRNIKEKLNNQE